MRHAVAEDGMISPTTSKSQRQRQPRSCGTRARQPRSCGTRAGEAVNRKAGQDGNQGRRYSADWEFQSLQGWSGWPASDGVKGGLPHGLQRRQEDDHTGRRRHKEIPAGSATEGLQPRRWLPRHLAQTGVADQDCPQSAGEANLPMGRAAQEFSLLLPPGLFGQSGASAVRR